MKKLIKIEGGLNPDNDQGTAWISYWRAKPTLQEYKQAFIDKFAWNKNEAIEKLAYDYCFWYDWNMTETEFDNDVENLADPDIHKDGVWVIPICQMV